LEGIGLENTNLRRIYLGRKDIYKREGKFKGAKWFEGMAKRRIGSIFY